MKKLFFFLLIALPAFAFAQFNKGNIFLGGTLSSLLQNGDSKSPSSPVSTTTTNLGISPTFGFFLSEKIAVGTSLTYSTNLTEYHYPASGQMTKYETNSFGISPYIRYYFPVSNSVYFGLHGGLSFSRSNSTTTTSSSTFQSVIETPAYTLGLNLRPVFIFFPSSKWGIEASIASLGYNYGKNLPDAGSSNSFGLNAGSFSFGVAYYFIK